MSVLQIGMHDRLVRGMADRSPNFRGRRTKVHPRASCRRIVFFRAHRFEGCRAECETCGGPYFFGYWIGSAVSALRPSSAKRDFTLFSGARPHSFL